MKSKSAFPQFVLTFDAIGAILFAGGLALGVAAVAGEQLNGFMGAAVAILLVAGGLVRAVVMATNEAVAAAGAQRHVDGMRQLLIPHLLSGRLSTPLPPGEAAAIAVDQVEALRMRALRFAPVRFGAVAAPLLVLAATAAASLVAAAILLFTFVFFVLVLILVGTAAAREADAQLVALHLVRPAGRPSPPPPDHPPFWSGGTDCPADRAVLAGIVPAHARGSAQGIPVQRRA